MSIWRITAHKWAFPIIPHWVINTTAHNSIIGINSWGMCENLELTWQCQSASPLDPGIRPSKWGGQSPVSGTGWCRVLGFLGWFRSIPLQFQPYSKHLPTINVTPNFHHPLSQASRIRPIPPSKNQIHRRCAEMLWEGSGSSVGSNLNPWSCWSVGLGLMIP